MTRTGLAALARARKKSPPTELVRIPGVTQALAEPNDKNVSAKVAIAIADESGYPHEGRLDFAPPVPDLEAAGLGLRGGQEFAAALGLRRFSVVRAAGWVVGLIVATRVFAAGYLMTLSRFGFDMPEGPVTDLTRYFGRDAVGYALTVLLVVIVGPFFEEVVFRGVLMGYLQERTSAAVAITVSAVVFSAYHFNAWTFVPVAAMGAAAGWIAARCRSVWPAYALHLGYNAVAVVLTFAIAAR